MRKNLIEVETVSTLDSRANTKNELAWKLHKLQEKYRALQEHIDEETQEAYEDLDPCSSGMAYINSIREEAEVGSITKEIEIFVKVRIPIGEDGDYAEIESEDINITDVEGNELEITRYNYD
jgi:hypothetical protein